MEQPLNVTVHVAAPENKETGTRTSNPPCCLAGSSMGKIYEKITLTPNPLLGFRVCIISQRIGEEHFDIKICVSAGH